MCQKLIMISGKLHSGKNAFAEFFAQEARRQGIPLEQGMLASVLKDSCLQDFRGLSVFLRGEHGKLLSRGVPPEVISWMDVKDEHF